MGGQWCALLITAMMALSGCGPSDAERCRIKLAALEATEREAMANIVRQRGECEAVAIEFRDAKMSQSCMDTLNFVIKTANDTQAAASARRTEPDMRACSP